MKMMLLSLSILVLCAAVTWANEPVRPATTASPAAPAGAERIRLWENTPGVVAGTDSDTDPTEPTMDIYLPPTGSASGAGIMVLPGGGYTHLSTVKEGSDVARVFVSHKMAAFVVRYRHAPRYHNPIPLLDAQRALRTIRAHAADYGINPNRIGVVGFSAGGHLAASLATMFDSGPKPEKPDAIDAQSARPDFAILMYPVINMTDDAVAHKGSRDALTQKDQSLYAQLSPEQHVTHDTPPIFLCHSTADNTVPVMNSVLMYEACLKARVPVELHLFQSGPHGFGLAPGDPQLSTWPDMAIRWLQHNKFLD